MRVQLCAVLHGQVVFSGQIGGRFLRRLAGFVVGHSLGRGLPGGVCYLGRELGLEGGDVGDVVLGSGGVGRGGLGLWGIWGGGLSVESAREERAGGGSG